MSTNKEEKKKGAPAWVTRRRTFNFGLEHSTMLDDMVANVKKVNHRANATMVVEDAIKDAHARMFSL